ncbi:MAG: Glycosyl hydrolase catalytic core protein, partial [Dehalococcoidia bacterium]|nr:Glycosyl hydrolase catalytic core protein [Dehalococcoidia bacterium]
MAIGILAASVALLIAASALLVLGLDRGNGAAPQEGVLVMEVSVPQELPLSEEAYALTEDGAPLEVSGDQASLRFQGRYLEGIDLPVVVPSGQGLASFSDPVTGISLEQTATGQATLSFRLPAGQGGMSLSVRAAVLGLETQGSHVRVSLGQMEGWIDLFPVMPQDSESPPIQQVRLEFELRRLPEDALMTLSRLTELIPTTRAAIDSAMDDAEPPWTVALALDVQRTNLDNGEDMGEAALSFLMPKADPDLATEMAAVHVDEEGRAERLALERETTPDGDSLLRFLSPRGLSTFAVLVRRSAPVVTPTPTAVATATLTAAPSALPSPTPNPTTTVAAAPTPTPTLAPTPTLEHTPTALPRPTPTSTLSPTPTLTPVPNPTPTSTPPPSSTPTSDVSPAATPTATATPSLTSTPTPTPTTPGTPPPTDTPAATSTPSPTATLTPIPNPTPTSTPPPSSTPTATPTPMPPPSSTPTPTPTPTTTSTPVPQPDEHYGVTVHTGNTAKQKWFLDTLGTRWFLDWTDNVDAIPAGHEKVITILSLPGPSPQRIQEMVQKAPGSVWYIVGEPNRRGTNYSASAIVTQLHDLYAAIKAADPAARITSPSVLNWDFTCIGCGGLGFKTGHTWVAEFRAAYLAQYGTEPPVDIWAIDIYPLDWLTLPTVNHQIVIEQAIGIWGYLNSIPAQAGKPIWITEMGLHWGWDDMLWPGDAGYDPTCNGLPQPAGTYQTQKVIGYFRAIFDWLDANADSKNIQRWFPL